MLGPRAMRLGPVSISLTLGPLDLSGMSDLYDTFLEQRRTIGLRAGNTVARVPTIDLAHLLVTKVTRRGDKAKDLLDVNEILGALRDAGQQVDLANVRLLVQGDAEARALIDQMDAALSEEDD